ncbi:hypothetical protein QE152_g632 [Popillia japonica]|uniref:EB domain-containing protein n=1 Tax=Popillia japonica TaxID=7064 RepID=A0AAW1NIJ7_POPJA
MTYPPLILVFCMLAEQSLSQDYSLQFLQTYNELNGACRTAKDCRPFGYICKNNKTCDCSEMYRPDVYKKQCVGGVEQKCTYDEHCIEGAYCMNQEICKCKELTPFILEEGMVCARSNIHSNTILSVFYYVLIFITLIF